MIYLDNGATTKLAPEVFSAMQPFLQDEYGNASSTHYLGESARRAIEEARVQIAKAICAKHDELIFTGSGTESNNLVIKGLFFHQLLAQSERNHIITTKIEHDCVLNACRWLSDHFDVDVTYLDVDEQGFVDPVALEEAITDKTFLVSIIHGNNEVGTIQDLEQLGKIIKGVSSSIAFHTDACQSFCKTPLNVGKMGLDFVTLNAHKLHGPKGVGALYVHRPYLKKLVPLLHGGGHEKGLRSSTENVAGIVGFARAVDLMRGKDIERMRSLRDAFIEKLLSLEGVQLNGAPPHQAKKGMFGKTDLRLCNNINIRVRGVEGEMLGSYLNAKQIFISTGSACASHATTNAGSHVLKALALDEEEVMSSVRITISKYTTWEEIDEAFLALENTIAKLR